MNRHVFRRIIAAHRFTSCYGVLKFITVIVGNRRIFARRRDSFRFALKYQQFHRWVDSENCCEISNRTPFTFVLLKISDLSFATSIT